MRLLNVELKDKSELVKLANERKLSREDLQDVYDDIKGAKKVKRLRNRAYAIDRIWAEMSRLGRNVAKKPKAACKPRGARDNTKRQKLIAMLKSGATVMELMEAMDWQAHTIRGLISSLNSKGVIKTTTTRKNGVTTYKAAA
jgi:hypothetical protein